ncbi:hypothetical protein [Haliea sp.]|jgi:DNA-binding NarL/FixJ family response regulator|uniref:hypothetical protein n=1 Tax=Haliea sp. TaxID=1932666 RepID=UPI00257C7719|nr:hypothetical protein [Haliea sp.]|tara:strand:+ start:9523 stop:9720 length:198 start_codon:yes stop_codon:yes gene_type:complete
MAKTITQAQEKLVALQNEGFSVEEIANASNLTVASVKAQLRRVEKKVLAGDYTPPSPPLFSSETN